METKSKTNMIERHSEYILKVKDDAVKKYNILFMQY